MQKFKIAEKLEQKLEHEYLQLSVWVCIAFVFGALHYFSICSSTSIFLLIASVLMISSYCAYRKQYLSSIFFVLLGISFCGGILASYAKSTRIQHQKIEHNVYGNIVGVVEFIKPTAFGMYAILSNVCVDDKCLNFKIKMHMSKKYIERLFVGDKINVRADILKIPGRLIPTGYDFSLHTRFAGIGAMAYPHSKIYIKNSNDKSVRSIIQNIRKKIYHRITQTMGSEFGNFAAALILGESGGINKDILQNMRYAGLSHILCVSGLHLTLVSAFFFVVSRFILNCFDYTFFNLNVRSIALTSSIIGAFVYLILSNIQIAATRAFIMVALGICALLLRRRVHVTRAVSVSAVLMLIINPEYVLHPSFELSFMAVFALAAGYESYYVDDAAGGGGMKSKVMRYIKSNMLTSILVALGTTTIVIYDFYIFSSYTMLSNLLAIPITSYYVMPLAMAALLCMPIGLDYYILQLLQYGIKCIVLIASLISKLPYAVIHVGHIEGISLITYLFGFFWIIIWKTTWRWYGILMMCASVVMMCTRTKPVMIFHPQKHAIGIEEEGRFVILSPKASKFLNQYWTVWFGQQNIYYKKHPQQNFVYNTKYGQVISILENEFDCSNNSNIVINNISDEKCSNADINIGISKLKTGPLLIFCNKHKCKIVDS